MAKDPKLPKDFVAEIKVIEEPIGKPVEETAPSVVSSKTTSVLNTGQFKVLQDILTQIRQESASKEKPTNGKIEIGMDKVAEMEKVLDKMREEIVTLSIIRKPVSNGNTIYLIIVGMIIVIGLVGFLVIATTRPDLDPLIVGGIDFGFVTAIVTLLINTMMTSKANDRQEEAARQRQELLLKSEETLNEAKHTRKMVNSGFTEWKETYLKKEYAEGQRAGMQEEQQRAEDLKKGE